MRDGADERHVGIPLTPAAPATARRWFDDLAALPTADHDRAILLISELVTNSVRHSGAVAPDEVEVVIRTIPGGLRIEVVDPGEGLGPRIEPVAPHGLRLVESMSDRWGYDRHPARVWFEVEAHA